MTDPEISRTEPARVDKLKALSDALVKLLAGAAALAVVLTILLVAYRQQTNGTTTQSKLDQSVQILKGVQQTNKFLLDCTTPGHTCYDQAHRSSSATVHKLDQVIILANYCATVRHLTTLAALRSCVENGLK